MTLLVLFDGKKNYYMTDREWELFQNFMIVLKPFREVTQYLCQVKVVTSTQVLILIKALISDMTILEQCM